MDMRSRTDEDITNKLAVKLGINGFDQKKLTIETTNGVVTISGEVDDPSMREKARRLALQEPEVRKVNLKLAVPVGQHD